MRGHSTLGLVLFKIGRLDQAISHYLGASVEARYWLDKAHT